VAPFDGIRGFGVLGVMAGHALPDATLSFSAIVDVFFVISGFLITTLLLQEHRETGRVNVRKFYARRLLRLLPALYVMLAGSVVVGVLVKAMGHNSPVQTLSALAKEVVASAFYVHNLVYPANDGPWIDHLWTLSIEEQFYLAIGIVALIFIVKGRIKAVTVLLVALTAAVQLSRLFVVAGPLKEAAGAVWLQRPDSLMVGMIGAIVSAHIPDPVPEWTRKVLGAAGYVAIPVLFVAVWASTGLARTLGWNHEYVPEGFREMLASGVRPHGFYWFQWGNTAANWAMVTITLCAFRLPEWRPNRFLSLKFFVWSGGLLSYSLYLWHVPVQELIHGPLGLNRDGLGGVVPRPVWVVLAISLPFLVAYPSYKLVETRAVKIKNRFAVTESAR
jgi:peptidoglycan/LPS O-acetylase OafA/YrhL